MSSQKIFCSCLEDVPKVVTEQGCSHLMTLINDAMIPSTPPTIANGNHLKLAMNDIAVPTSGLVIPQQAHIEKIERFVLDWDQKAPLLVHCWAGISRSSAGVFISMCILNPESKESDLAQLLRKNSPISYPNRKLVQLADDYLRREGRMVAAVAGMGRGEMAPIGEIFSVPAKI